jgi:RNA polymerase sigma-70 factor (ECF subfamily)
LAQAGDRQAYGTLYERFSGYVYSILLAQLPRPIAEDLVQDVFMIALERLASLREPAAFAGWIAAIARRRAIDTLRGPVVAHSDIDPAQQAHRAASPETQAAASQVLDVIRHLPEAYRETLILRLVQGMTGPEIAVVTGLTPDSVRVNLHRGFKLLREALGGVR